MTQRHSNYNGFVQAGIAKRSLPTIRTYAFLNLKTKNSLQKVPFENLENRKGLPKTTFYKSLALGPSNNMPWERFRTNMKKH